MLASLGINEIGVFRKLRVAFFSTGDELRSIGQPLAGTQGRASKSIASSGRHQPSQWFVEPPR